MDLAVLVHAAAEDTTWTPSIRALHRAALVTISAI